MSHLLFEPRHAAFAEQVRASFTKQGAMSTLGAQLDWVSPSAVYISLHWSEGWTQRHGFLHAGAVSTALDSACGYAALTPMPRDAAVSTIEFKINWLAPADGEHFRLEGRVLKPVRTITVCEGRAYALAQGQEKLMATMGCTLMTVTGREALKD